MPKVIDRVPVQVMPYQAIQPAKAYIELEKSIHFALEMYSNVHRGTGQNSLVSTHLFEHARKIVLDYLKLPEDRYTVIFCTHLRAKILSGLLRSKDFKKITSHEIGLPLGVEALAIRKTCLPKGRPFETGGGTVKIVSRKYALWAPSPDRYEAGTPSIINIVTFARALQITQQANPRLFKNKSSKSRSITGLIRKENFGHLKGAALMKALQKTHIGTKMQVPTEEGMKRYTNLDNGASTPTFEPVWEVVRAAWQAPNSQYAKIIAVSKKIIQGFLGSPEDHFSLVFTSNTTEALNIFARQLRKEACARNGTVVINTLLEHNSNELPWRYIPGVKTIRLNVDDDGFICLADLEAILKQHNHDAGQGSRKVSWITISGASNVLGSFNDLTAISELAHRYGARVLVDAAQLVAHRKVDMAGSGIDALVFSGHKVYAPFGSGALIFRRDALHFTPAELNAICSSGEENICGIAALAKICSLLSRIGMDLIEKEERKLTRQLIEGLKTIRDVELFGVKDTQSVHFLNKGSVVVFSLKDVPFNLASKRLAEIGGIGVRSGCFCSHLLVKHILHINPFRALLADAGFVVLFRFTNNVIPGLVRVSIGLENTPGDIQHILDTIKKITNEKHKWYNRIIARTHNSTPIDEITEIDWQFEEYVRAADQRVYST